jgi:hypothetical protein
MRVELVARFLVSERMEERLERVSQARCPISKITNDLKMAYNAPAIAKL